MKSTERKLAESNLQSLAANPYPGRGLAIGMDQSGGNLVQIYWIMGRSENSRNRIFGKEDGRVFTLPADPAKVKDPSLIIYDAMREGKRKHYVVSNGDQTNTVADALPNSISFEDALSARVYEPDAPNYTPRITGYCYTGRDKGFVGKISILRKSPFGDHCDRIYHTYERFAPGFGHCVTTYMGDGSPLPSFKGDPYLVPIVGDIDRVAKAFWLSLDRENQVSLAVKFISIDHQRHGLPSQVVIINKYKLAE